MPFIIQFGSIVLELTQAMLNRVVEGRLEVIAAVFLAEAHELTKAHRDISPYLPDGLTPDNLAEAQLATMETLGLSNSMMYKMVSSLVGTSQPFTVAKNILTSRRIVMGNWVNEAMTTQLRRQFTKPQIVPDERTRLYSVIGDNWDTNFNSLAAVYWGNILQQGLPGGTFFSGPDPKRAITALIRTMYNL